MEIILANTISGLSRHLAHHRPDMLVLHGDRVEALAGAKDPRLAAARPLAFYAYGLGEVSGGALATTLFALGIIGTGLLAVPILSGTIAYAVAEVMAWKGGLSKTWSQAQNFYGVLALAMFAGLLVNMLGVNVVQMLIHSAVLYGVIAPPILASLVYLCNHRPLLGRHVNGRWANALGALTVLLMTAAPIVWFALAVRR